MPQPHSCHHLLLFDFLRTAILTVVKLNECQCSFDLLCPTAKDNEQFFTYLLGLRTSFENCLLTYYAHFLMDYLFWCLTFWVLCRFWILTRWIAGRFPPILEALFILGSSFFMLCNPICQVLGLFPVLWRPLVPICPQILIWPQTHSPLPDPHLTNGHEVRRLWRTPRATGGVTSHRSTRPTLDHLPTLPDPTLDICNKLRYMKHYNLLNTLQSGNFFSFLATKY